MSALALLSVLAVSVTAAVMLSQYLRTSLVKRDVAVLQETVQSVVAIPGVTDYFTASVVDQRAAILEDFFTRLAHLPDVVGASAYAADGSVLWSNDQLSIGERIDGDTALDRSLSGEMVIAIDSGSGIAEGAGPLSRWLAPLEVEAVLPIRDGGVVVGAARVIRFRGELSEIVAKTTVLVWATMVVGGLLLYFVLFWLAPASTVSRSTAGDSTPGAGTPLWRPSRSAAIVAGFVSLSLLTASLAGALVATGGARHFAAVVGEPAPDGVVPVTLPAAEPEQLAESAEPGQLAEAAEPEQLAETAEPEQLAEAAEPEKLAEAAEPEKLAEAAEPEQLAEASGSSANAETMSTASDADSLQAAVLTPPSSVGSNVGSNAGSEQQPIQIANAATAESASTPEQLAGPAPQAGSNGAAADEPVATADLATVTVAEPVANVDSGPRPGTFDDGAESVNGDLAKPPGEAATETAAAGTQTAAAGTAENAAAVTPNATNSPQDSDPPMATDDAPTADAPALDATTALVRPAPAPPQSNVAMSEPPATVPSAAGDNGELRFWQRIKDTGNRQLLQSYLNIFPDGRFGDEARQRLANLERSGEDEIEQLVARAWSAFDNNALTTPTEDNALLWAEEALRIDPDGKGANEVLQAIIDTYLNWSRNNLDDGSLEDAQVYLQRALALKRYADDEQRAALDALRATLRAATSG